MLCARGPAVQTGRAQALLARRGRPPARSARRASCGSSWAADRLEAVAEQRALSDIEEDEPEDLAEFDAVAGVLRLLEGGAA